MYNVYTSTYLIVTILTIQGVTKIKYVILIRVSVDTYTTRGKIRAILFHKHVYGNAPPPRITRVGQLILFTVLFTVITMGSSQRAKKNHSHY